MNQILKINEIKTNRVFELVSKYDKFTVRIPKEFIKMTPNQLWLLSHQITAFGHGFDLDNGHIIDAKKVESFKYPNERKFKWVRVDPSVQQENLKNLLGYLCDYKENWENGQEYDCHPQNFDEFLNHEKNSHWSIRLEIFFMIVLMQDINSKNVTKVRTPEGQKLDEKIGETA